MKWLLAPDTVVTLVLARFEEIVMDVFRTVIETLGEFLVGAIAALIVIGVILWVFGIPFGVFIAWLF